MMYKSATPNLPTFRQVKMIREQKAGYKRIFCIALAILLCVAVNAQIQPLKISASKRFIETKKGKPFFWLGDTGWLLLIKCSREEAVQYLDDRAAKGFNVIQAMLLHDVNLGTNKYGDSALQNKNIATPFTTKGKSFENKDAYDFWDNVDFVIKEAAKRNMYMALVPIWGGNIKNYNIAQCNAYASFLAKRYKNHKNIIWLNGGDIKGSDKIENWKMIGNTIKRIDTKHLMTFHPRGRTSSSTWFHNEPWLDFNMFQSGHRSYAQDTSSNETLHYGEDNWRYMNTDFALQPTKPSLDGEPSYEGIPYGLHKANEPYWQDDEIRRYAYWNAFAGACGFTYGHNAVMQFYSPGDSGVSFFPKIKWQNALVEPGAGQMKYLKNLMERYNFENLKPAQQLVIDNGEKYYRVAALSGFSVSLFYTYNGKDFKIDVNKIGGLIKAAYWFCPKNGNAEKINLQTTKGIQTFNPPGEVENGNDWVLVLEKEQLVIR